MSSVFLFILPAEGITSLLQNVYSSHCYHLFPLNDNLHIDLLQFSDDTTLVGQPSWENVKALKTLFRGFEFSLDLSVNFSKSRIMGYNVEPNFFITASDYLSCAVSTSSFLFFGIQIGCNSRRSSSWSLVLAKVRNRLALWKGKNLRNGKENLRRIN